MRIDFNQNKQGKWAFVLAAACALVLFLVLQVLLTCGTLQRWIPDFPNLGNLASYVVTVVLFVVLFCMCLLVCKCIPMTKTAAFMEQEMTEKSYKTAALAGSAVLLLLLAIRRLFVEKEEFAAMSWPLSFRMFPLWLAIPLFVMVAGVAVFWCVKLRKDRDISRKLLLYGTAGILVLNMLTVMMLNIFHGDVHHGVAYVESIYNVYYGVPFERVSMGIYGFYGLFLAPILHLFGGNALAVTLSIAFVGCCVVLLCAYCIWTLVEENYFRILALLMCCMGTISMRPRNYWQVQPHRVLWPLILVAFVLFLLKKNRWRKVDQFIGYCLCMAAVLWNVESGIFCSIAFAAACIVRQWQQQVWYHPKALLKCLMHIGCVIATVLGAMLIVNGYNYLCGSRQWLIKDFFFPIFETSYVSDLLEVDMPIGNHAWVYVLILFGTLLLSALYMTSFGRGKAGLGITDTTKFAPVGMMVAVLGLCSFSYYANRAAYRNLDIILQLAGIANCLLWRGLRHKLFQRSGTREDCAKTATAMVTIVLVVTLAIETLMFSVPLLVVKVMYKHYDTRTYQQSCQLLEESIPENTFAFGGGISMLYADLGWDPIGHYRDISDLLVGGEEVVDAMVEDALAQDAFAVYLSTGRETEVLDRILLEDPSFELEKELDLNGKVLQYYIRSDE